MTVPAFPNFFMLLGPNTFLGHNSVVFMIETQVCYIARALKCLREKGYSSLSLREAVYMRFNRTLQARSRGTIWTSGCKS
jgi:cation diffusion facilitator CzcD-associated flavoprotein CzcO